MNTSIIARCLGIAVIALTLAAGIGLCFTEAGRQLVASVLNRQPETPERPEVLVVADDNSDLLSVITTVEPRGYDVLVANNTEAGIHALGNVSEEQLKILVIDPAVPNSNAVLRCVKAAYPNTRIITVDHRHSALSLTRQLLDAIV